MTIADLVAAAPLQRGASNHAAVRELQTVLSTIAHPIAVDGWFGGETVTTVESIQRDGALAVTGIVDRATAALIDGMAAQKRLQPFRQAGVADRPPWLIAALKYVGTHEAPGNGNNPTILSWAKRLGGAIAAIYTADSIPWCALFQNACLESVGIKGTGTLWALDFARWGVALRGPAVGCIGTMSRAGGGHVVQVVGRDQYGNLMCVGGNQSDAVSIKPFPPSRFNAFRWPAGEPLPAKVGLSTLPLVKSDGRVSTREA